MLVPDITANIRFYTTEENGRKSPMTHSYCGSIFSINNKMHDCRLLLDEIGPIFPGDYKINVPIKFLCPELVIPKLTEGSKFHLREMRNIAEGEVTKIIFVNE